MAYHRNWSEDDLRQAAISREFSDYDDCGHFPNVLYKGEFYMVTFLRRKEGVPEIEARPEFAIAGTQREYIAPDHYMRLPGGWRASVRMLTVVEKEQGNALWKALKATQKSSKKSYFYYSLDKAAEAVPGLEIRTEK